jgi:predicted nucleic acid-binding protein
MSTLQSDVLVVDAGIGYRLFIPHPEQAVLRALISAKLETGCRLVAPTLWRYEVTSVLARAVHQRQLTQAEAEEGLALSQSLPLDLIAPSDALARAAFVWTLRLQRASAYDSFYLALAQQLQCELWTFDKRLANAVGAPWVRYLGQET